MKTISSLALVGTALLLFAPGCATAPAPCVEPDGDLCPVSAPVEELTAALASPDGVQQARARQLLPYYGPAALPALLPLLGDENAALAKNAYYVVLSIADASCAPGREAARTEVTDSLMALLDDERPEALKVTAIRLLERIVAPDYDLKPIAALLKGENAMLREKARAALTRIASCKAKACLIAALDDADAPFQAAILNGLAEIDAQDCCRPAEAMLASPDASVRLAAARVLANCAEAKYGPMLARTAAQADDATRGQALDACLRLAQTFEAGLDMRSEAREIYAGLTGEEAPAIVQGALAGLGRTGDEEDAGLIAAFLGNEDIHIRHTAIDALGGMAGAKATEALLSAYASASEDDRALYVLALGRRPDGRVLPHLREAMKSSGPFIRRCALQALGRSPLPGAADTLIEAAGEGSEDDRVYIEKALLQLAAESEMAGDAERLLQLYTALFRLSDSPGVKVEALQGLAAHPSTAYFDLALEAAGDERLGGAAAEVLVSAGAAAYAGGDTAKGEQALDKLFEVDASIGRVQAFAGKVQALGGHLDITPLLGGIAEWHVIGPFAAQDMALDWAKDFIDPKAVDVSAPCTHEGSTLTWKALRGEGGLGTINLLTQLGNHSTCFAYAYTTVSVPERTLATLRLGSDDGVAAWINGAKAHDHFVDRGMTPDSDVVPIRLEAGKNEILLKIQQGQGGWCFCARLTARDGRPLAFEQGSAK